tara:strand:+ start:1404 stop:3173 length:1770 start_codon:yes stop_codon:yes gene_type:complete
MKNPLLFYQQEKENFEQQLATLNSKLSSIRFFRFIVFLSTAFAIYTFFENRIVMIISAVLGIIVFIWLVLKYINFQRKKQIVEARIEINSVEISVLNGNFSKLENGKEFSNSNHFYSNDIDLFGDGSLFQYINRTETLQGKSNLAKTLLANKIDGILERQNAIKELDEKVNFRQHFSALASLNIVKKSTDSVSKWIKNYSNVFPVYLSKIPLLFSGISLLIVGLISFGVIQFSILVIWFFIGLFVTAGFIKKTSKLYKEIDEIGVIFKQYYQLLQQIENENFITKNLKEKQEIITLEQKKASNIFKEFSKILDAFDNRNNDIIAVVGNGLFLMEIKNACKVEKWISNYKHTVEKWFDVVAFFDAQNSLANFNFNHPNYTFPVLNRAKNIIKSESLGHPLLNFEKRIDNDFTIEKEQFFIVTGANMAGKSTFLRTVSLTIVMANIGLPVCAKKMEYNPIKLITSMRTSDSLAEEESYFYAELKRLKFIVDKIASEEYFIILDEILKGTNSKDKAIGSKKFVEKLSNSNSTGIIATHDVSLCVLEDEFKNIENYFFDAEINEDELYFDYTLKKGICKNMNASFLLKKMEII